MAQRQIELAEDMVQVLDRLDQPIEQAARELIVMELYRREFVSSGKAADLLGMSRVDFIRYAGTLGVSYFRTSIDEVRADADRVRGASTSA